MGSYIGMNKYAGARRSKRRSVASIDFGKHPQEEQGGKNRRENVNGVQQIGKFGYHVWEKILDDTAKERADYTNQQCAPETA